MAVYDKIVVYVLSDFGEISKPFLAGELREASDFAVFVVYVLDDKGIS
jgi:hypothetical protein